MIVDFLYYTDSPERSRMLKEVAVEHGFGHFQCAQFDEAVALLDSHYFRVIVIDLDSEALKPLQFIEWIQTRCLSAHIALMSDKSYRKEFLQGIALGALDFFGGFKINRTWVGMQLTNALKRYNKKWEFLTCNAPNKDGESKWIGFDADIRYCLEFAKHYSGTQAPILIKGENGVGKSLIARFFAQYHDVVFEFDAGKVEAFQHRKVFFDQLFAKLEADQVNRIAIIVHHIELLEFEVQEFLAETLKSGLIERDGLVYPTTLQVIATTTLDVQQSLEDGVLRQDLVMILSHNVFEISPLRQHAKDIPFVIQHMIWDILGDAEVRYFSKDAMDAMQRYSWPGNIDELRETMEAILSQATEPMISSRQLPASILTQSFYTTETQRGDLSDLSYIDAKKTVLNKFNRDYIDGLLRKSGNNLTVAAERAGMDRSNFKKIVRKYSRA